MMKFSRTTTTIPLIFSILLALYTNVAGEDTATATATATATSSENDEEATVALGRQLSHSQSSSVSEDGDKKAGDFLLFSREELFTVALTIQVLADDKWELADGQTEQIADRLQNYYNNAVRDIDIIQSIEALDVSSPSHTKVRAHKDDLFLLEEAIRDSQVNVDDHDRPNRHRGDDGIFPRRHKKKKKINKIRGSAAAAANDRGSFNRHGFENKSSKTEIEEDDNSFRHLESKKNERDEDEESEAHHETKVEEDSLTTMFVSQQMVRFSVVTVECLFCRHSCGTKETNREEDGGSSAGDMQEGTYPSFACLRRGELLLRSNSSQEGTESSNVENNGSDENDENDENHQGSQYPKTNQEKDENRLRRRPHHLHDRFLLDFQLDIGSLSPGFFQISSYSPNRTFKDRHFSSWQRSHSSSSSSPSSLGSTNSLPYHSNAVHWIPSQNSFTVVANNNDDECPFLADLKNSTKEKTSIIMGLTCDLSAHWVHEINT